MHLGSRRHARTTARRTAHAPVRLWRTGAIAVVMAALGPARAAQAEPSAMQVRLSRFDVAQTAQRIETSARRHGLGVFASVTQRRAEGAREVLVLVLESPRGGTPVLMQGEGDLVRAELPLRVELSARADGYSEVRFPTPASAPHDDGIAQEVAGLPALVADALRAG